SPSHGTRLAAEAVHLQRLKLRNLFRKKLRLHFLGDHQLVLQALLLFLLNDQLFDGSRHRVEGICQLRQLIFRSHRNAMTEIATVDVLGCLIKLSHRAGDGARQVRANEQSKKLNHGKKGSDEDQSELDCGSKLAESGEKPLIKHGQAGLYT